MAKALTWVVVLLWAIGVWVPSKQYLEKLAEYNNLTGVLDPSCPSGSGICSSTFIWAATNYQHGPHAVYHTSLRAAKFLSMVGLSRRDKETEFEFVIYPTCLKLLVENSLLHVMLQYYHRDISGLEGTRQYLSPRTSLFFGQRSDLSSAFMFVPAETALAWQPVSRKMRVALGKLEERHRDDTVGYALPGVLEGYLPRSLPRA